jgi:hypothetical protein
MHVWDGLQTMPASIHGMWKGCLYLDMALHLV